MIVLCVFDFLEYFNIQLQNNKTKQTKPLIKYWKYNRSIFFEVEK